MKKVNGCKLVVRLLNIGAGIALLTSGHPALANMHFAAAMMVSFW